MHIIQSTLTFVLLFSSLAVQFMFFKVLQKSTSADLVSESFQKTYGALIDGQNLENRVGRYWKVI